MRFYAVSVKANKRNFQTCSLKQTAIAILSIILTNTKCFAQLLNGSTYILQTNDYCLYTTGYISLFKMFCFHASIFAGSHRHLMNHWTKSMRFSIHLNESLCCVQKWEWIDEFRKKNEKLPVVLTVVSSCLSSALDCRLLLTVVCSRLPSALECRLLWLSSACDCCLLLTVVCYWQPRGDVSTRLLRWEN